MEGSEPIALALTPMEKWSAARELKAGSASEHWHLLGAGAALVVLVALLLWVSNKRRTQNREQQREAFAQNAARRGLGAQESQILTAIAARSGMRSAEDIFRSAVAFEQGATELLAECARTRTPEESEQLRVEVAGLREKLGFPPVPTAQLEASLQVKPGDRVLVVFELAAGHEEEGGVQTVRRTMVAAGWVKHCRKADRGASVAVELAGLGGAEANKLARAANEITSLMGGVGGAVQTRKSSARVKAATP